MLERVLIMTFENESGKRFSIKIKDVVDSVDEVTVGEIMSLVIEKGIFLVSGGPITKKVKCELVSTESTLFAV